MLSAMFEITLCPLDAYKLFVHLFLMYVRLTGSVIRVFTLEFATHYPYVIHTCVHCIFAFTLGVNLPEYPPYTVLRFKFYSLVKILLLPSGTFSMLHI